MILKKDNLHLMKQYKIPRTIKQVFNSAFDLTDAEINFLNFLYSYLVENNFEPNIKYNILSNGIIDVKYNGIQIGRIKLKGKKLKMQILTSNKAEWFDGDLKIFMQKIPYWLEYIEIIK